MTRAVLLLLLVLVAPPALGQRSLAIKRFDADISVSPDGTIDVSETITAEFTGSWNGLYRTIPVEYHTPQGFNWTLRLDLIGATEAGPEGRHLRIESARERHYIKYKIWVPNAENVTRTVVMRYRAMNGLRFFEDHDELYWNVTGDEWDVPIEAASATIDLPATATGVRAIAFNGAYGSTAQDAKVETTGTTIRLTMPHPLGFHEGLTAVVGWDKGVVAEPTAVQQVTEATASNWPLAIPIAVFAGMFTLWYRLGRDPRRLPVVVQYEPPALTPAEAGTLIDYNVDMRDITATMVDLAVRGHLRIEEKEESHLLGLIKRREYVFHRLEPPTGGPGLEPHEQQILSGLFQSGRSEVELSDLEDEFYRHLPGIRATVFARLVERGLYRGRPDKVRTNWRAGGIAMAVAIIGLGVIVGPRVNLTPVPIFLAAGLSGLIMVAFARFMPARTATGARALERVLGFEEFLRRVEGERFERLVKTPEMFERLLPFAMAFRVERRWARAFQGIYREPPRWYVGSTAGGFDMDRFSGRLADLSSRTQSTMTSSPRSSGGSGFSSGGSSGGGGGGGGGGGF